MREILQYCSDIMQHYSGVIISRYIHQFLRFSLSVSVILHCWVDIMQHCNGVMYNYVTIIHSSHAAQTQSALRNHHNAVTIVRI